MTTECMLPALIVTNQPELLAVQVDWSISLAG